MRSLRRIYFFRGYFEKFYRKQPKKVKQKTLWTLQLVQELEIIPEKYFKAIRNSSGLYEIRIKICSNIYRIFCFFDKNDLVVVGHGFQKKSQKLPKQEIEKAERIRLEYYESKET